MLTVMSGMKWYEKSYRRNLVDMHIEDWDERFLSRLDPENYVRMLKLAGVKSAMVYANSHVGYCYWPTRTGRTHRGIKGRDVLGEIIDLCHKEEIDVIIYYSLIFNNWAYEQHPEWRIVKVDGKPSRVWGGRYGVCCPNSPGYRRFVLDQIEELCRNYDFEGVFFDMTFWPTVCYCPDCRERYREETGEDPPTVINWDNPSWIRFQRKREEWLAEFASVVTSAVKKHKPEASVEHQYSTVPASWVLGVTSSLSKWCDYVGGDFYGGVLQQSFICKLYYNLTPNMPFEFMTSICYPGLGEHTTVKSKELNEAQAFLTIAHNGAFLIIDAIDPIGTLDERRYRMVGDTYRELGKYEKYLGGELCQDVAIYFSLNSKFDFAENGKKVSEASGFGERIPHLDAALGAAESLRTSHIPFGVITDLKKLPRFQVVVLPNVLMLSDEEVEAIRKYVAAGGSVYASKFTLKSKLSEILGVTHMEETPEKSTYVAPTEEGKKLLPGVAKEYPLSIPDSQIKAEFSSKEGMMATIALPYTKPDDPSKFASIHSNPPGIYTDYPAIVCKNFGKGRILWSSASIETYAVRYMRHRSIFAHIVKYLAQKPFSFEANAPECVEITQVHKPEEKKYLINIVNFQSEIGLPNIPVHDILLRLKIEGTPRRVISLPDEASIPFEYREGYAHIKIPVVETFRMLALEYENNSLNVTF
ncbi:MAG: family 10 glycosylhydrolase [Thermoproteota archaeon]